MSFVAFLIGTLLASSLALLVLLVAPQVRRSPRVERGPVVGLLIAILLMAIGFIGGLSLAG